MLAFCTYNISGKALNTLHALYNLGGKYQDAHSQQQYIFYNIESAIGFIQEKTIDEINENILSKEKELVEIDNPRQNNMKIKDIIDIYDMG